MNVVILTAAIPWGDSEQFIYPEIDALLELGCSITLIPIRPSLGRENDDGFAYQPMALGLPLFAPRFLLAVPFWLRRRPRTLARLLKFIVATKGSFRTKLKNLVVLPKALHLARKLYDTSTDHIHVHWLSTPSTVGMIVSTLTGIPWSVTAHRWDIAERNLLTTKAASASFIRVISEDGRFELAGYLNDPDLESKLITIHMGVDVPPLSSISIKRPSSTATIAVPGRLVEKKGHSYLLQALAELKNENRLSFRCLVIGDGPLRESLLAEISRLGLTDSVEMVGQLTHQSLLSSYTKGEIDIVVLPSIVARDSDREGIPVSLMEAMAAGVPVVATPTGGTAELVDGVGLLVPEKNPSLLADAIEKLGVSPALRDELGRTGRQRVEEAFTALSNVERLMQLWSSATEVGQEMDLGGTSKSL